ncbi:hypothetical protein L1277_002331 [Okibacterium sp. HSC-33S16]|uniref:hypothetical protein n=1 Tax=Okibacterium sp. HSC-33S16 TaxID=2910965 RepID=UPI0020A02075|nr:hypothetical protein [Okibacterium sp. HSC-33S16]MCP2032232.1 hypothetical protein [Okibacterium sp. HSC-33S16]
MTTTVIVMAALSLAGCSVDPASSVYDGEQTDADRIPDFVMSDGNAENYDLDSSRFLGTAKGREFYAVRSVEMGHCIATVVAEPVDWHIVCSPSGEMRFSGSGVQGRYFPGGYPEDSAEDGWISVHPSLRIQE